jgi:Tfp pilus assembly protein PilF
MLDPTIDFFNIIRETLRNNPNVSQDMLIKYIEEKINKKPDLANSLRNKFSQDNQGQSAGYQTIIEGGKVNIGGVNITLPESGKFDSIFEAILNGLLFSSSSSETRKTNSLGHYSPKKILVLPANPGMNEYFLDRREMLEVQKALNRAARARVNKSQEGPIFEPLIEKINISAKNFSQVLSEIEPNIVHISGCENGINKLISDQSHAIDESDEFDKLTGELFKIIAKSIQCIILDGCYLESQAKEVVCHIDYLVGIDHSLDEKIRINFLNEFYFHLGLDLAIRNAYTLGCNLLLRNGLNQSQLPILLEKDKELEYRRLEKELANCNQEIDKSPKNPSFWTYKGKILGKLGRSVEADSAYEKAFLLEPNNYNLRTEQGDILEAIGSHEKALAAYNKALDLEEKDYRVWWKKGRILARNKKYSESIEPYEYALSLNPLPPDKYVISRELGFIYSSLEQNRKSIVQYRASLQVEPRYRAAKYEKKQVYKKMYSPK